MTMPQSVDWNHLQHAYGSASDIPELLEQLNSFPKEESWQSEPWFSLWSALYHQGDIYPASIAAVPVIVSIVAVSPQRATLSFYLLPASICIADHVNPVEVNNQIRMEFKTAIAKLGQVAELALPNISDPDISTAARAAVLVSQGDYSQAAELLEADA